MLVDIIDIPEIQQSIACHLDPQDLASSALVSKAWGAAFLPYLWHSIYVEAAFLDKLYAPVSLSPLQKISRRLRHMVPGVSGQGSFFSSGMMSVRSKQSGASSHWRYYPGNSDAFRTPSPFFLDTLRRRGHHIRHLSMFRWDDIPIVGPHCRYLTSLSVTVHRSEHCWPATLELAKANPNLVKVSVTMAGSEHLSNADQMELFRLLPGLKELDMTNYQGRTGIDLILQLLAVCPRLGVLRLKTNIAAEASDDLETALTKSSGTSGTHERCKTTPSLLCSSLASLRELEMAVYNTREIQHNYLLPWLKHCPGLTYFKLPDLTTSRVPELCTLLQHHLHYIEKLDLSHLHFLEDESFAALIVACSSLHRPLSSSSAAAAASLSAHTSLLPSSVHSDPFLSNRSSAIIAPTASIMMTTTATTAAIPASHLSPLSPPSRPGPRRPALRQLLLECCSLGFHTVNAILTHHRETLEVLNIKRCRERFRSEWIQALLCNCAALRVFESGQSVGYPLMVTLNAEDMYQSRWACTNLEVLQVSITGICHQRPVPSTRAAYPPSRLLMPPSPGEEKGEEEEEEEEEQGQEGLHHNHVLGSVVEESSSNGGDQHDHAKCMAMQAHVYEQLGQLRHLRRLDVGRMGKYWASEEQRRLEENSCLEWTLSSGMLGSRSSGSSSSSDNNNYNRGNHDDIDGPLSQLRHLEELGVAWIQHSLGPPELEWMKRHWPRLHKVLGDEQWMERQPAVRPWVAAYWPELQMACRNRG